MRNVFVGGPEDLARLFGGGQAENSTTPEAPRPIPEAQVMMLRELAARYGKVKRFSVGDIITPSKGVGGIVNQGEPHIVLEIRDLADAVFQATERVGPGNPHYGSKYDIRVLTLFQDEYLAFWSESWVFEAWQETK